MLEIIKEITFIKLWTIYFFSYIILYNNTNLYFYFPKIIKDNMPSHKMYKTNTSKMLCLRLK